MAASPPWKTPDPKKKHHKLTPSELRRGKAWAKSHGQPWPSLIANMAAMKKKKK